MNPPELSAIVTRDGDSLEAQILEIDIAARGKDMAELVSELAYAITMEYRIAKELNKTPFARLKEAPSEYFDMWKQLTAGDGDPVETHSLNLDDDVQEALAIALHADVPVMVMTPRFKSAA